MGEENIQASTTSGIPDKGKFYDQRSCQIRTLLNFGRSTIILFAFLSNLFVNTPFDCIFLQSTKQNFYVRCGYSKSEFSFKAFHIEILDLFHIISQLERPTGIVLASAS